MTLKCPVCRKIAMKAELDPVSGLEIDTCPSCSGMWFDAKELNQFFESPTLKRKFFLSEESMPLQAIGYTITTRARVCPRCKISLSEKLFGDVTIDICHKCEGLWLDEGERQRRVIAYKKGHRGDKSISKELSVGLTGKEERPSIGDVIYVLKSFLGIRA
jgi:Zn-finger nucleic acid-binding protein